MANNNATDNPAFVEQMFKPVSDLPEEPLAKQPLAVKVGVSIDQWVRRKSQKDRINWLRTVITNAALDEMNL